MNRPHLLATLGLSPDTPIYLTGLTYRLWGQDLHFACIADETVFAMHFADCRDINWQIYTHMSLAEGDDPAFPRTELVNLRLGRFQHRSPGKLLTPHFGLSLVYDTLAIIHADEKTPLDRPT
ncbi:MAG: hypothetical protein AAFN11_22885 [Chloroflexota bacterium]